MSKKVIIIGAGASGMTAAIFAARGGADVTLLEHTERLGRKILSTGNGKCNLSNWKIDAACYRSSIPDFPMAVINQFGPSHAVAFFEDLGIIIKEQDGRLYPASGQAASVLEVLRQELARRRVKIITECNVQAVSEQDGSGKGYQVKTSRGTFYGSAVVLAAGSKAAPATGSDGSGYRLAEEQGLKIIKPLPALVQLRCKEKFYKQISGVRIDGGVALYSNGVKLAEDMGELQLTDYGISGIPVFQVSRFASAALSEGKAVKAIIDFYPPFSHKKLEQFLKDRRMTCGYKPAEEYFTGWFNRKLSSLFLKLAGIDGKKPCESLTDQELKQFIRLIKEFSTEVTGTNSFEQAQICCGGVDVKEINKKTMEAKKKKGLYLIGELLDVDGICGGYNLQWAWSTGAIAGIHAGL